MDLCGTTSVILGERDRGSAIGNGTRKSLDRFVYAESRSKQCEWICTKGYFTSVAFSLKIA